MTTKKLRVLLDLDLIPDHLTNRYFKGLGGQSIDATSGRASLGSHLREVENEEKGWGICTWVIELLSILLICTASCMSRTSDGLSAAKSLSVLSLSVMVPALFCILHQRSTRRNADTDPTAFWNKIEVLASKANLTLPGLLSYHDGELKDECKKRLEYLAKMIRQAERLWGELSPSAEEARKDFKDAHRIFLEFCLVNAKVDEYFPKEVPSTPVPVAA